MRRFYEQSLWIPQNFLFTNLDLHHGLLGLLESDSYFEGRKDRQAIQDDRQLGSVR